MSMVQYGSINNQTNTELSKNESTDISNANDNNNNRSNTTENANDDNNSTTDSSDDDSVRSEISDSDSISSDQLSDSSNEELPQITRHIDLDLDNLNQPKHIDEEILDDDEKMLNKRLQELIDRQVCW